MSVNGSYLLRCGDDEVDLLRFQRLVDSAGRASTADESYSLLTNALALWRGECLADLDTGLRSYPVAVAARQRWFDAVIELASVASVLGRLADTLPYLQEAARRDPWHEGVHARLMAALTIAGRQGEALRVYETVRRRLADDLGVDPGAELGATHLQVLRNEIGTKRNLELRPRQLPAAAAHFTGRTEQLRRLDAIALREETATRICVVAGAAGVGKTALAVHWAHRVAGRFPDGQLYVNLAGHDSTTEQVTPADALSRFVRALGAPAERIPEAVEELAALYRSLVAGRRMLVLLDNVVSAGQARPLLPGEPGCLVVVTSRNRLPGLIARDGAERIDLGVLPPEDAGTLLAAILGAERISAEAAAARELADLCAYLPLALRIAAAKLANNPHQAVASMASQLRDGDRLAALEVADDQSLAVRAAFDLSFRSLDAEARQLFRRLGLVAGPTVTPYAAAALIDADPGSAGGLLDELAAAHLIEPAGSDRYQFHDLLRVYAADLAAHQDEQREAAVERLLSYYLHTADACARLLYPDKLRLGVPPPGQRLRLPAVTDPARAWAWLDAERANLVAAVRHAAQNGHGQLAWLLADALRGYFVRTQRYPVDWMAVGRSALAAAALHGDLRAQAAAQHSLATAHLFQSRYAQAREHYAHSLAIADRIEWLEGRASVLGNLGVTNWLSGRLDDAGTYCAEALATNRRTGNLVGQATNLANLGCVCHELGRLTDAVDHYTVALAAYRRTGQNLHANVLANLGQAYHAIGDTERAADHLAAALELHRRLGHRGSEVDSLRALAALRRDLGRPAEALDIAEAALALARDVGVRRVEAAVLNTVGTVYDRLSDHREAVRHHEQALRLSRKTGNPYPEVQSLLGMAAAYSHLGQVDKATDCADHASALASTAGYRLLMAEAMTTRAEIELCRDAPDRAIRYAEAAIELSRETGSRPGEARAAQFLSVALSRTDRKAEAAPGRRLREERRSSAGVEQTDEL